MASVQRWIWLGMSAGRTLAGGLIQADSGGKWVDLAAVVGRNDDWTHAFKTVTTTKLRIYGVHAPTVGLAKNPIVFEWRRMTTVSTSPLVRRV